MHGTYLYGKLFIVYHGWNPAFDSNLSKHHYFTWQPAGPVPRQLPVLPVLCVGAYAFTLQYNLLVYSDSPFGWLHSFKSTNGLDLFLYS